MANIVDRRQVDRHKSSENRKKFIARNKKALRAAINDRLKTNSVSNPTQSTNVKISKDRITEPTFSPDSSTGSDSQVLPGNRQYKKGDIFRRGKSGQGQGQQRGGGNSDDVFEDEFRFMLTEDEFLDLLFDDMALPNFVKRTLKRSVTYTRRRAGYTKDGIPAMLSLKKTFENAIARRIAARAAESETKPPYLDDIDLRYKRFDRVPQFDRAAVMFCVMDVSGSMGEQHKIIAKKFYILLNLFLKKVYSRVDLVFVKHHTIAREVDEHDFFYSKESGGTIVSSALNLVNDIIDERYNPKDWNIYVAQASDGDNWQEDNALCKTVMETKLLPKVQYFTYIEIDPRLERYESDLSKIYNSLEDKFANFRTQKVATAGMIYMALKELFKKGGVYD